MSDLYKILILSFATGAMILLPLLLLIYLLIKRDRRALVLGLFSYLIFSVIGRNLLIHLVFYLDFLKVFMEKNILAYSLFLSLLSLFFIFLGRFIFIKRFDIKDELAFSSGETVLHLLYLGIPTLVVALVYMAFSYTQSFFYLGIPSEIFSSFTKILNANSLSYLPYLAYPFWLFFLNYFSYRLFSSEKTSKRLLSIALYFFFFFFHFLTYSLELYLVNTGSFLLLTLVSLVFFFRKNKIK